MSGQVCCHHIAGLHVCTALAPAQSQLQIPCSARQQLMLIGLGGQWRQQSPELCRRRNCATAVAQDGFHKTAASTCCSNTCAYYNHVGAVVNRGTTHATASLTNVCFCRVWLCRLSWCCWCSTSVAARYSIANSNTFANELSLGSSANASHGSSYVLTDSGRPVEIVGFGTRAHIFESKQKPKLLTIYGSDFR